MTAFTLWGFTPASIASHIRSVSYMGSGCGSLIADTGPSSVTQLPILTALHARSPTLFGIIIQYLMANVNPQFTKSGGFL